ncbi:hypothetical protein KKY_1081 [Pelagibacterium halotolerans B2]|uniref:Uncharacterized protein n=1 Tax=Pelagibacterium halotolerans (strain DSM 22347 / JCM 15775 / CGMCC 1.7692 / B2) TaxID=1082931 RepID=G4R600_PELHB|nr:hypothetical protein KKY_1081 [Pelagibacterium halotolerans B2]
MIVAGAALLAVPSPQPSLQRGEGATRGSSMDSLAPLGRGMPAGRVRGERTRLSQ